MAGGAQVNSASELNLKVIQRSTKKPEAGDIFAMRLPNDNFLFGRVIGANLSLDRAPMPGANLVYIYRSESPDKTPELERLLPTELLIPPLFTNRMGWTKGYFQTVLKLPLQKADFVAQHCFRRGSDGRYLDDNAEPIDHVVEPCGDWGLVSYRWIDDRISDALGYERAP